MAATTSPLVLSEGGLADYESTEIAKSGFLHDVRRMTLAWHNICVTKKNESQDIILDGIYGHAMPEQVVALMGASGAGKTTLLNTLMNRNLSGLDTSGTIIVGGSQTVQIGDVSAYVQQEEMFLSTLTPYEHLMFQAGIRLPKLTRKQLVARVGEIMDELGLRKCKDSEIGIQGIKKGISGGESKRLAVASVLLDNPSILFLDEPTTGLDSHMAQSLMNCLRRLARAGRTVVCTIHQPSSKIFNMLDTVIFLGAGQLAYHGSPKDILPFFDSLNLICPVEYNPADYIIDVLAIDRQNGNETAAVERVHKVANAFRTSEATKDVYDELCNFEGSGADTPIVHHTRASWGKQTWLLLQRSLLDNKRNPGLARAKVIQKLVMGIFVGLLYLNTKIDDVGIMNINGAIFYLVSELTYSTTFGILSFLPNDFPLIVREHFDGLYKISAYYVARVISYMPIFVLDGVIMMTISYWMIGLVPRFEVFLVTIGIGILVEQCAAGFGVMLSTVSPSYTIAISVAGPILTVLSLTGGLFANVGEIPVFISWTQYFSWFKYGFEALTINQWRSQGKCIGPYCLTPQEILQRFSFSEAHFWPNIGALLLFVTFFYVIGYIGLYVRVHRNR